MTAQPKTRYDTDMRSVMSPLVLLALALAALPGCATVHPWERGRLAHPSMLLQPELGDAFRAHMVPIREGAIDATGGLGGGCAESGEQVRCGLSGCQHGLPHRVWQWQRVDRNRLDHRRGSSGLGQEATGEHKPRRHRRE